MTYWVTAQSIGIINAILLLYFVPVIVSYLAAKLFWTFTDIHERPGLFTVLLITVPYLNWLGCIVFGFGGIMEFLTNGVDWARKRGDRTIGERFLKMEKKESRW
jgi:hypothetical protein